MSELAGDPPIWNWPWGVSYSFPSPPTYTWSVPRCPACGACHTDECSRKVKAIEYHENGTIKRVEYEAEEPSAKAENP